MTEISNYEDIIDSRDIIARIEELESELESVYDEYKESFREEYEELVKNNEIDFEDWIEER
jgi:uncharacterized protein (UPF0335 family)